MSMFCTVCRPALALQLTTFQTNGTRNKIISLDGVVARCRHLGRLAYFLVYGGLKTRPGPSL